MTSQVELLVWTIFFMNLVMLPTVLTTLSVLDDIYKELMKLKRRCLSDG